MYKFHEAPLLEVVCVKSANNLIQIVKISIQQYIMSHLFYEVKVVIRMSSYSKIILSNGNEYIVPIKPSVLIEGELINKDGEIYNRFILVPQIDLETGNKMHVTLNPQHIVTIEEVSIKIQPNVPSVFRVETNNERLKF